MLEQEIQNLIENISKYENLIFDFCKSVNIDKTDIILNSFSEDSKKILNTEFN